TTTGKPRIDLDPERYVLDYAEETSDKGGGVATSPTSASEDGSSEPPLPPEPPTIYTDNTFVDPGESPFVSVDDQPKSTFGLDVDTGSFSVGRTFLAEGTLPPPESVRTEEWVNALGSDQPAPTDGELGVAVTGARWDLGQQGSHLLRVGVAAQDLSAEDRPAANLTFVVDTSGSMDIRERLGLVKASLGLLVLNLRDDDTISIVEYSDDAGVILEPTPVRDAQRVVDAIDELQPSNSTNLEAGLREGYEQAEKAYRPDTINAVILASDGVANVGLTDPDGLAGVIQDRAADGIHLVTVGYGMGNYNDDLMEQVADKGDGFYAYLDTYEQAENLFRDRLTSTLAVVAGDAKAQVTFDPGLVQSYRLIGYENRALDTEDFDDETVDAGEVGAGHRVTALYEVVLPDFGTAPPDDKAVGTAAVRYRSASSGQIVTTDAPITYGDISGSFDDAPADFRFQAATAAFAEWLGEPSSSDEGEGRLPGIRVVAEAAAAELPEAGLPGSALTPDEMVDLMVEADGAPPAPEEPEYHE
ncbi:MAG: von Willebrand factor type A domain-containing protein, partial [Acidimicrobiia bacterium]|nr:von Willebrand factor type A domain-containing protein [Acidimicrobiia bacterium]